ncbi:hypothetical protein Tco_0339348 [Tanacetum coccineum]
MISISSYHKLESYKSCIVSTMSLLMLAQAGGHLHCGILKYHSDVLARFTDNALGLFVTTLNFVVSNKCILTLCPNEIYTMISSGSRLDLCTFGFSNRRLELTATFSISTISDEEVIR